MYPSIPIYPNNYQDHLNNLQHTSEKNNFNWIENDEPLIIDSGKETIESIISKIYSFIKN